MLVSKLDSHLFPVLRHKVQHIVSNRGKRDRKPNYAEAEFALLDEAGTRIVPAELSRPLSNSRNTRSLSAAHAHSRSSSVEKHRESSQEERKSKQGKIRTEHRDRGRLVIGQLGQSKS